MKQMVGADITPQSLGFRPGETVDPLLSRCVQLPARFIGSANSLGEMGNT